MVRSIVGTLVAVGQGRVRAGELLAILRSGDRSRSGQPAPPRGLCLVRRALPGGSWSREGTAGTPGGGDWAAGLRGRVPWTGAARLAEGAGVFYRCLLALAR